MRLALAAALALLRRWPPPGGGAGRYEPVVGGGSFNAAPILEPGPYRDTLLPTEYLYYAFRLEPGQRLHVTANADMPIQDFQRLGLSDITANLHSPTRSRYPSTPDFDVRGNFRVEGDPPLDITGPTAVDRGGHAGPRPVVRAGRRTTSRSTPSTPGPPARRRRPRSRSTSRSRSRARRRPTPTPARRRRPRRRRPPRATPEPVVDGRRAASSPRWPPRSASAACSSGWSAGSFCAAAAAEPMDAVSPPYTGCRCRLPTASERT